MFYYGMAMLGCLTAARRETSDFQPIMLECVRNCANKPIECADTDCMERRTFLALPSVSVASLALGGLAKQPEQLDAAWYQRSRRFASLPTSRVAYVEHVRGPVALFLHC